MSGSVKSPEALAQALYEREKLGEFNSWEKDLKAFTYSTTSDPYVGPIVVNKMIADSSIRAKNINTRRSIVVAERELSDYEAFQRNMNDPTETLEMTKNKYRVFSTRCAEGIEATAHPPFYYDSKSEDVSQLIAQDIMTYCHPTSIVEQNAGKSEPVTFGSEVFTTYLNADKSEQKIDKVLKNIGLLPDMVIVPPAGNWGGAMPVYINGVLVVPRGSERVTDESSFGVVSDYDPEGIVEYVTEELGWQPEFNPLATGTKTYTKIHVGSRFAIKPGRVDPMGSGKIRPHGGIDIWVAPLTPIVAPAAGTISSLITPNEALQIRNKTYDRGRAGAFPRIKPAGAPTSGGGFIGMAHRIDDNYTVLTGNCHIVRVGTIVDPASGKTRPLQKRDAVPAGHVIAFVGGGNWGYTTPNVDRNPINNGKLYCTWPGGGGSTGAHNHFSVKIVHPKGTTRVDPLAFKYLKVKTFPDEKIKEWITTITAELKAVEANIVGLHESLFGALSKKKLIKI